MPELAYEYLSTLVNTKPLNQMEMPKLMEINPITHKGRLSII